MPNENLMIFDKVMSVESLVDSLRLRVSENMKDTKYQVLILINKHCRIHGT